MSYSSEVLADSPIAYWKLDDPRAVDASGNGNDFLYNGGVTPAGTALLSDGGTSVHGDGTHAIATRAGIPSGLAGGTVSVEAWVKIPSGNVNGPIVKVGDTQSNGWGVGVGGTTWDNVGKQLILLNEGIAWSPTGHTFSTGIHHVVVTRSSGNAFTVYVDGTSVFTTSFTPTAATGGICVGGYSTRFLSSTVDVDNVALYASVLSSGRVTAHYNSGSGDNSAVSTDTPLVWLKLDETTVSPVSTDDSSGNSHPITHQNAPTLGQGSLLGDGSGSSVSYNGSTQYSTAAGAAWMATPSGLTVEARIRPNSGVLTGGGFIAAQWAGGTPNIWLFGVTNTGKLTASVVTGGTNRTVTGATTLVAGTDYTVALRWTSGGNLEVFLNGVSDGSVAASGSLASSSTQALDIGRAANNNGAGLSWNGRIDEVSITGSSLSNGRMTTRHSAAVAAAATPQAFTGKPAGLIASARAGAYSSLTPVARSFTGLPTGATSTARAGSFVAGTKAPQAFTGIPNGITASARAGAYIAGTGFTPQAFTGRPTGAVLAAPKGSYSNASPAAQTFTGRPAQAIAAAPKGAYLTETLSVSAQLLGGAVIDVSSLSLPDIVVMTDVTLAGGGTIQVDDLRPVIPMTDVTLRGGGSIIARPHREIVGDPRTGIDQWRYVVTDLAGTPLGELVDIEHDPVEDGVDEPTTMAFKIAMDDPTRALIKPIERQCQVWQGDILRLRGPILPGDASDDGTVITHTIHDPSWWWRNGRRTIGRIPKQNLLRNGDFTQGLTYWTPGFDKGSIPAAAPHVVVVNDDFTDGGKAAQITGVESVTETKAELQSSAVYWPNRPYAGEPLEAGFRPGGAAAVEAVANAMPTTPGLKVKIVGHTANDGTGSGIELSKRRAEAAKVRVLAKRPSAIVTTSGVGFYQPNPKYPINSQQQRRVVISYESTVTISGKSKQWIRQTVPVTQPKSARYPLQLAGSAWLKVTDDWSVEDANMVSVRVVARRQATPTKIWEDQSTSISDTDPVDRWIKDSATVTIPPDGRTYLVDVYLYAPAALARYTRAALTPVEVLYFWGVDQALIAKGIAEHMQDPAMGHGWPITVGTRTPLTGVKRDRQYPHYQRMRVDTALDEFPALFRGMDIDVLTTPTDTTLATFYPRQGQVLDYVLVLGGNVAKAVPAATRDVGSHVIAQAQDTGPDRDEAYAADKSAFGGLMLERVITAEQDTPINELDETAAAELGWAKVSTTAYWVDIDPDSIPEVLAQTSKGDTVRLILDGPDQVDALARIVRRQNHPTGLRMMLSLEV